MKKVVLEWGFNGLHIGGIQAQQRNSCFRSGSPMKNPIPLAGHGHPLEALQKLYRSIEWDAT